MKTNPIFIIGLGLADDSKAVHLLPSKANAILKQADIIAAGRSQLAMFPEHPARRVTIASPVNEIFVNLEKERAAGAKVVILADGDPQCCGIGISAKKFWGDVGKLRILPNISSAQGAAAFLGLNLSDLLLISLHGRDNWSELGTALLSNKPVVVFTDEKRTPGRIAELMLERGVDARRCHVLHNLRHSEQGPVPDAHYAVSVAEMAALEGGPRCLVVILPQAATEISRRLMAGQPDFVFASYKDAVMSSFVARNLSCGVLRPAPEHTVWDLGAGSGAMSIELCSRVYRGQVIAVEKKEHQLRNLHENRRRFAASNLEIISDVFPECLTRPEFAGQADRIFIGGGFGPALDNNFESALAKLRLIWDKLKPGGRLAANCVLIESLSLFCNCFREIHGEPEILQAQINQSVSLAGGTRLLPDNPFFIVSIDKNANNGDALSEHAI